MEHTGIDIFVEIDAQEDREVSGYMCKFGHLYWVDKVGSAKDQVPINCPMCGIHSKYPTWDGVVIRTTHTENPNETWEELSGLIRAHDDEHAEWR